MRVSSNKLLQKYAQPTSHNAVTLLSAQNLSDSNFPEAAYWLCAVLVTVSFTYVRSEADCVWRALPRASAIAGWRTGRDTRTTTFMTTVCFYLPFLLITTSCQLRGSFLTGGSEDQKFRLAPR